jgi:Flp pilus assembly protein TadG
MRRRHDETGSAAAELVIVTPLFLAFLGAFVTGAQVLLARQAVADAARGAVEAAVSAPTAAGAAAAAGAVGHGDLGGAMAVCARGNVSTETYDFVPGGFVTVDASCSVALPGLVFVATPRDVVVSASAVAPIERYRVIGS